MYTLQMGKLRLREGKELTKGHTAGQRQSLGLPQVSPPWGPCL